jgi:hypothetical protein
MRTICRVVAVVLCVVVSSSAQSPESKSPIVLGPHTVEFKYDKVFKIASSWYDVTIYGAVCDGVTDNTAAFANAKNDALSHDGILYIPPCATNSTYAVNESAFSNSNTQSWLYVVDENDLTITGGSISGANIAIFGRGNQHQGIAGDFVSEPHIDWISNASVSPLDANGLDQAWFEGILFFNQYSNTVPAVNLHTNTTTGAGIVFVTFKGDEMQSGNCAIAPALKVGPDAGHPDSTAGFGLFFSGTGIGCTGLGNTHPAAQFVNYGDVSWSGPVTNFFGGGGVSMTATSGFPGSEGWYFENVLAENFGPQDFFTFKGPTNWTLLGDVVFNNLGIADSTGSIYLFGTYGANVQGVTAQNMSFDGGYKGLLDPQSSGNIYGADCFNAPGCLGLGVGRNIRGLVAIDPAYGRNSAGIYFGSSSSSDPALTLDSPSFGAALRIKQALILGTYTVSTLPPASEVGQGALAIVTDALSVAPGDCSGAGSTYMIAISNGTSWTCH